MTQNDFLQLCLERLIDPGIALENEHICKALRENAPERIVQILEEEF